MKRHKINTIPILAASFFALAASANASDLLDGLNDPAPTQAQVNWTGFFAGGQFGYGIASQRVTTLSTEHFDAVPSRCYAEGGIEGSDTYDHDGDPATDKLPVEAFVNGGIAIIGMTEAECLAKIGAPTSGSGSLGPNANWAYETGFNPAVDAHDVTTKTVFDGADSGLIGGFQIGFDKQMGRVVAGVFADYNWSDIKDKDHDWTVGGRLGFLIDSRMMLYGFAGYTQAEYDEADYEGWTIGGGAEYALKNNVFLGAKYSYTDLGEETLANTPTLNVVSERDEHKILMDLKIKLNSDLF